jgi:hypothetical protein
VALTSGCAVPAELDSGETEGNETERRAAREASQDLTVTPIGPIIVDPPLVPRCGLRLRPLLPIAFRFDGGNNQSFQSAGLYDGDTWTFLPGGSSGAALWWDRTNAPGGINADPEGNNLGSLLALAAGGGLPLAPSGYVRSDVVTPDLAGTGWQGRSTFSVDVLESIANLGTPALQIQMLVEVDKCDGTRTFLRQVNANGQPVFCPTVNDQWKTCTFTFGMTNVQTIRHLHIRIFGVSGGAYEGGVWVDNVVGH